MSGFPPATRDAQVIDIRTRRPGSQLRCGSSSHDFSSSKRVEGMQWGGDFDHQVRLHLDQWLLHVGAAPAVGGELVGPGRARLSRGQYCGELT